MVDVTVAPGLLRQHEMIQCEQLSQAPDVVFNQNTLWIWLMVSACSP